MTFNGENLLVGLIALALVPVIGWRVWRGVKYGQLPLYRTRIDRSVGAAKFNVLLGLHVLAMLLLAVVAVDLLLRAGAEREIALRDQPQFVTPDLIRGPPSSNDADKNKMDPGSSPG